MTTIDQSHLSAKNVWKPGRSYYVGGFVVLGYGLAYLMSRGVFGSGYGGFPDALHLAVDKPVDVVFKWTGEKRGLGHGLRRLPRIDARTTEIKQPRHTRLKGPVHEV